MQQEAAFLDALTTVITYEIQGSTLEMSSVAGERVLAFTAKAED